MLRVYFTLGFRIIFYFNYILTGWAGYVMRMEKTRTTRKITEWTPYKARPVGRHRLRWKDQVEEDLKRMRISGW
jgi:hypothetical protein